MVVNLLISMGKPVHSICVEEVCCCTLQHYACVQCMAIFLEGEG